GPRARRCAPPREMSVGEPTPLRSGPDVRRTARPGRSCTAVEITSTPRPTSRPGGEAQWRGNAQDCEQGSGRRGSSAERDAISTGGAPGLPAGHAFAAGVAAHRARALGHVVGLLHGLTGAGGAVLAAPVAGAVAADAICAK